jgi:DNA-binding SARP family transcriptional activator/Tfp pilus assembly protein PilF
MGDAETEFRLLGPMEVWAGGQLVDVGPTRQRSVLAVLLLEANRSVPVDRIVEWVWGERSHPDRPRNAVQTYVSLLRRALAKIDQVAIAWQSGGYVISVDKRLVDVHAFRRLIVQARGAGGNEYAIGLLDRALGLWRGEALGGFNTPWLDDVRARLDQERQAVERDLTDLQLRQGLQGMLLPRLFEWAEAHPLDERVAGQLMLALFRSGRQADALREYQRVRERLSDEVGTDPGPALRDLYRRILIHDEALDAPAAPPSEPVPTASTVKPRQLPAAPRSFTGRARELARLSAALDEQPESGGTLAISAIGGVGGVGKTWLALHWAHQHIDRFPDGQLYINLRGFDPAGEPVPSRTAVRGFLDALGVAPAAVPADEDAQTGLFRSLMADRRILILLDNARDTAQVLPLLPGSPTCVVLVTSRQQLTGLISAHGAHPIELDMLSLDESRDLLARHIGYTRVAADPEAATALLARCAGLPLAISIVAARALIEPDLPLAVLADELSDASARLDALATGDLTANVRAALSWSYDALDGEAARALSLLALAPGPEIGIPAAASLTSLPTDRVRAVLGDVKRAHLLQHNATDRYRTHDLVRLYATERAHRDLSPEDRAAALRRLVDFYLCTAHAADHLLNPERVPIELDERYTGGEPLPLPDRTTALAWFVREHACLLAALRLAAAQGWDIQVWQLAWALDTFHNLQGHTHDQIAIWRLAIAAAQRLGDPSIRSRAHCWLGYALAQVHGTTEAVEQLHHALALTEQSGDTYGQAHTHYVLAGAWGLCGDDRRALHHAECALSIFRTLDRPSALGRALNAVGWFHARLGEYAEARASCLASLALHRRTSSGSFVAAALDSLGYIAHHTDNHHQALDYYHEALALRRDQGSTYAEAGTLDRLAQVHLALGRPDQARDTWNRALRLYKAQHRLADAERVARELAALA